MKISFSDRVWAPDELQISNMRAANRHFYTDYYKRRRYLGLRYDYIYRKRLLKNFLMKMGIVASRKKVLDVGFGHGDLLFMFDLTCELHGIEMSLSAVELARQQAQLRGYANYRFIEHDLHYLVPYPDESFDMVICSHVLEHLENDEPLLSDLYRVLKTEGYLFLFIPIHEKLVYTKGAKHIQKYTVESLRQMVKGCKFSMVYTLEHQFFDRPFKVFGRFARRYPFVEMIRSVAQYTMCFILVHTCVRTVEHLLKIFGCKATSLFLVLKKSH